MFYLIVVLGVLQLQIWQDVCQYVQVVQGVRNLNFEEIGYGLQIVDKVKV